MNESDLKRQQEALDRMNRANQQSVLPLLPRTELDLEMDALRALVSALLPLDEETRRRVIRYAEDRFLAPNRIGFPAGARDPMQLGTVLR